MSDEIRRFQAQYDDHPESLVFARLADAYRKAGELERGLEVVEEGLARHPDYLSGHIVRARILRQLERPAAASAAFHRVLTLDPQNLVALRSLGALARERGDTGEARAWYTRVAELEPLDEGVREVLDTLTPSPARAPARSEEPGPAGDAAAREPDRLDDERLLTATMAELYMRQGLYEDAERIYRRLVRLRPGDEGLRERLESVRTRMGARSPRSRKTAAPRPETAAAGRPGPEAGRQEPEGGHPEVELDGPETEAAGGEGPAVAGQVTIRRYLRQLLANRAPVSAIPEPCRPSAFDAWLDRPRVP